jgi:acyl carrier protein
LKDQDYLAPRNETEEEVCRIWTDILGIEKISVQDDFFDIGGHSLLAASIGSRIREAFGVELKMDAMFEDRTIESLARRIEMLLWSKGSPLTESGSSPCEEEEFGEI